MSGKLYVVGIGPGNGSLLTLRALRALEDSDIIIGYKVYVDLLKKNYNDKTFLSSGMTKEIDRCRKALELAASVNTVSLVSSGDAGVYGMAGPLLELIESNGFDLDIEIVPGVTSSNASAALLGAPIMHDHCSISLSDRLTPWEIIEKRLHLAAEGDFVVSIYNPKSKGRQLYIEKARDIFLQYRSKKNCVGIVNNAERENQEIILTNLENMTNYKINMFSMVIIGNSKTFIANNKMITPRGYRL